MCIQGNYPEESAGYR